MNKKIIIYSISRIMLICVALMIIPLLTSLYFKEDIYVTMAYVKSMAISLLVFGPLIFIKPENTNLYIKEGFIITALTWVLMSFFGCLPLYLSGNI